MIQDKLILRDTQSPFTGQYMDITLGSILSHTQLDGNFIYLKGNVIYDSTINGNIVSLNKLNGESISFEVGSGGGAQNLQQTLDQGNSWTDGDNSIVLSGDGVILSFDDGTPISAVTNVNNLGFSTTNKTIGKESVLSATAGQVQLKSSNTMTGNFKNIVLNAPLNFETVDTNITFPSKAGNQLVAYLSDINNGVDIPDDFYITTMVADSYLIYQTDSYRQLDLTPLVGFTVTTTNEIIKNNNDIFIVANNVDEVSTTKKIIALYDCKIVNNILTPERVSSANIPSMDFIHGMIYHRDFIYLSDRASHNLVTTVVKINPFNLVDNKSLRLPNTVDFVGQTTDIIGYKNKLYIAAAAGYNLPLKFIEIDSSLGSYKNLFTVNHVSLYGTHIAPFLIYNDEIYIIFYRNSAGGALSIRVYDFNGSVKRESGNINLESSVTGLPACLPHWVTMFNDKLIITTLGKLKIARVNPYTLLLDEAATLTTNPTDDNTIKNDGFVYINGEKIASSIIAPALLKVKYNDFTQITTEISSFGTSGSYGSINNDVFKDSLKYKTSQFINDGNGVNPFITSADVNLSNYQLLSQKGQPNGYTPLNSLGLIDNQYLPSYVDDVLEFANFEALPNPGETGKIYVTLNDNKIYRWSGSAYIPILTGQDLDMTLANGSTALNKNITLNSGSLSAEYIYARQRFESSVFAFGGPIDAAQFKWSNILGITANLELCYTDSVKTEFTGREIPDVNSVNTLITEQAQGLDSVLSVNPSTNKTAVFTDGSANGVIISPNGSVWTNITTGENLTIGIDGETIQLGSETSSKNVAINRSSLKISTDTNEVVIFDDNGINSSQDLKLISNGSTFVSSGLTTDNTVTKVLGYRDTGEVIVTNVTPINVSENIFPIGDTTGQLINSELKQSNSIPGISGIDVFVGDQNFNRGARFYVNTDTIINENGGHGLGDYSTVSQVADGGAYASIDVLTNMTGGLNWNHYVGIQSRPLYTGSGNIDNYFDGINTQINHGGTGTINKASALRILQRQGNGVITNLYGIYLENQDSSNYAIYGNDGKYHFGDDTQVTGNLNVGDIFNYPSYKTISIGTANLPGLLKLISSYNNGNGAEIVQSANGDIYINQNGMDTAALFKLNGNALLKKSTISTIDTDTTGKAIITKEYLEERLSIKADDSNVVHKTLNETILGAKLFTSDVTTDTSFIAGTLPISTDARFYASEYVTEHAHYAFLDDSVVNYTGSAFQARAAFDDNSKYTGTENSDHAHSYQAYPHYNNSGTLNRMSGFWMQPDVTSGTILELSQFRASNPLGTGIINYLFGLYVPLLDRGVNNYAIYTEGSTPVYFGGNMAVGVPINNSTKIYAKQTNSYGLGIEATNNDSRLLFGNGNGNTEWRIAASYNTNGSFQPITFFTSDIKRLSIETNGDVTFANNAVVSTAPTIGNHLTNKTYVDSKVNSKISTGTASFTGDDSTITFTIPHGLNGTPIPQVTRRSDPDGNLFQSTANSTNIIITFVGGIPMNGNITEVNWLAILP